MNPELLKGNNIKLGVLKVLGDGLYALRPTPGDIFETPESFSELCGNSELGYTCQQLRVKMLMCVSTGNMSCEVEFRSKVQCRTRGRLPDAEPATRRPRAKFRRFPSPSHPVHLLRHGQPHQRGVSAWQMARSKLC
jgi:hypothetical protein